MKKRWLYYSVGLMAFMVTSCGDKSKDNGGDINLDNPTYAPKTVAETKADLENSGTQMVSELKSLNQEKGMQATVMFVDLMSDENSMYAKKFKASSPYKMLNALNNISSRPQLKTALKALEEGDDDLTNLLDSFDAYAGVYVYDFSTHSFGEEPVEPSENIVIKFPSNIENYDAHNNNASLEITRPQIVTGDFTVVGAKSLPSSFSFTITVDGQSALSYSFVGEYQADGIPTKIENTLTMGTWQMKQTYGYSSTNLKINYSFTHGSTNLVSMGAEVNGKLTQQGINEAMDSTWVEFYPGYGYWEKKFHFEEVVNNANAYFQLMDIKIAGQVDFLHLVPVMDDTTKTLQQKAETINNYADLVVVYASNNQAIAKAEAYVATDSTEWDNNQYIDMRLIFADKSKSSLDAYFNEGFDGLFDEMNSLIADLNKTYGWELKPIEKPKSNK